MHVYANVQPGANVHMQGAIVSDRSGCVGRLCRAGVLTLHTGSFRGFLGVPRLPITSRTGTDRTHATHMSSSELEGPSLKL
jgi:hypothetical protein